MDCSRSSKSPLRIFASLAPDDDEEAGRGEGEEVEGEAEEEGSGGAGSLTGPATNSTSATFLVFRLDGDAVVGDSLGGGDAARAPPPLTSFRGAPLFADAAPRRPSVPW